MTTSLRIGISKVVMFLEPNKYPVLDERISRLSCIEHSPITDLMKYPTYIPIHPSGKRRGGKRPNYQIYEDWASWCQGIAHLMDQRCDFRLRAVDVERGLFWSIGPKKSRISEEAKQLIYSPEGWTHEKVIDHARQLETKN